MIRIYQIYKRSCSGRTAFFYEKILTGRRREMFIWLRNKNLEVGVKRCK